MSFAWDLNLTPVSSAQSSFSAPTLLSSATSSVPELVGPPVSLMKPSIWQSITQPFVNTGKAIWNALPDTAGALSQGISNILVSKYLTPQSKNEGGQTIIYTDRPDAGITPPAYTGINISAGGGGTPQLASLLPSGMSMTTVAIIMAILFGAFLLMGKK